MTKIVIETDPGDVIEIDGEVVSGTSQPDPEPEEVPALVARWEDYCGGTLTAPEKSGDIRVDNYSMTERNTISVYVPPANDPYFENGFDGFEYQLCLQHNDPSFGASKRVYWIEDDGSEREFYNGTNTNIYISIAEGRVGKQFYVEIWHTKDDGEGSGYIKNQRYFMLGAPA
jgi:hypothetical protein